MALPEHISDREKQKFVEVSSLPSVRVSVVDSTATAAPAVPNTAGVMTIVALSNSAWTAVPTTPLANRKRVSFQNNSAIEQKLNCSNGGGYVGIVLAAGESRSYDVGPAIIFYGRAASSTPDMAVEEFS